MIQIRQLRIAALTAAFGFAAFASGAASAQGQAISSWGSINPFRAAQTQGQAASSWGSINPF